MNAPESRVHQDPDGVPVPGGVGDTATLLGEVESFIKGSAERVPTGRVGIAVHIGARVAALAGIPDLYRVAS